MMEIEQLQFFFNITLKVSTDWTQKEIPVKAFAILQQYLTQTSSTFSCLCLIIKMETSY